MTESNNVGFLNAAFESLENLEKLCKVLLDSGSLPKHFYTFNSEGQKTVDANGVPVSNIALAMTIVIMGEGMGMNLSQSLRHLVPLNGLIAIKGDMAISKIMNSGKCLEWEESSTGSVANQDYVFTIRAKRKDGIEKTIHFGIKDAIRMNLFISEEKAEKYPSLKSKPWYKTPERMCGYRAKGFMARDLFGDVINELYLVEEAFDINEDYSSVKEGAMTFKTDIEEKVAASNDVVTKKITTKKDKRDGLGGKKVFVPEPNLEEAAGEEKPEQETQDEVEPNPVVEEKAPEPVVQPKSPEPAPQIERATSPEIPSIDDKEYEEKIRKLQPRELVQEFVSVMKFDIKTWESKGGKRDYRTIVALLLANKAGESQLINECHLRGVKYSDLFEA